MPISCHFQDCKALLVLSPSHARSAIASKGLLPYNSSADEYSTYTYDQNDLQLTYLSIMEELQQ